MRVVLKDNKLAGFNPMELQMMVMPFDMNTGKERTPNMYLDTVLLAKLKPYLVPGVPVARNWQRLVGSPVSAQFFKMMKYDMGQCADAVRNTWRKYLVHPCSKKTDNAVRHICMKAVAQNIATLPLQNGVTNLDRTISTKFTVHQHEIKNPCGKGATYAIPASHNFDFTSSNTMVADTTKTGFGEPEYSFRCDAATDLYTLVLFDSMALPVKTRTGVPHMVRVNMGCTDNKMSDPKNLGVNLMGQYMPPANPMPIPFLYQFYLFKQSKRVVLKDNKLAGFNPMELQMMALPMDMTTGKQRTPNMYLDTVLLAKLKGYLVPGGPVARSWQRLVGSPVSAQIMKMMKFDMGQCADAVRNAWKYYLVTKMGPPALRLKSSHAS